MYIVYCTYKYEQHHVNAPANKHTFQSLYSQQPCSFLKRSNPLKSNDHVYIIFSEVSQPETNISELYMAFVLC